MSRAVEEQNRRLLRARDAMDRDYGKLLDVPSLARVIDSADGASEELVGVAVARGRRRCRA